MLKLMKRIALIVMVIFATISASCNDDTKKRDSSKQTEQPSPEFEDEHTAANSLDIPGVYEGNFDCADCEGIHILLTIDKDKTYKMVTNYIGNETNDYEMPGKWIIEKNTITLTDSLGKKEKYFAGENFLQQVDEEGNRMEGDDPDEFKLIKKMPES